MSDSTNNDTPTGLASVASSVSEIIIAELTGVPLRLVNRQRLLRTGDRLSNKFGQELWSVEAFHPKGVRVVNHGPYGTASDLTWEAVYAFYERVPADDPALKDRA
jgi:hypothetical protein